VREVNRRVFCEKIHNDISGVARLLGLTVRDTLVLIYDEGLFSPKDLKKIKKAYNLTDSDICEIFYTE
jgi:hypothetical protein